MKTVETLTIVAIILGPILSILIAIFLSKIAEKRERQMNVFKTLMATRAYVLSWDHVMALNRIDVEFSSKSEREKTVRSAWKEYHGHLYSSDINNEVGWKDKGEDLFTKLLYCMGKSLGYDFDKDDIRRFRYSPIAHETMEGENKNIRLGLLQILKGERSIPFHVGQQLPDPNKPLDSENRQHIG